jgi:hypothetical protein
MAEAETALAVISIALAFGSTLVALALVYYTKKYAVETRKLRELEEKKLEFARKPEVFFEIRRAGLGSDSKRGVPLSFKIHGVGNSPARELDIIIQGIEHEGKGDTVELGRWLIPTFHRKDERTLAHLHSEDISRFSHVRMIAEFSDIDGRRWPASTQEIKLHTLLSSLNA